MNVEIIYEGKPFRPVTVTIRLDTPQEVKTLFQMVNVGSSRMADFINDSADKYTGRLDVDETEATVEAVTRPIYNALRDNEVVCNAIARP